MGWGNWAGLVMVGEGMRVGLERGRLCTVGVVVVFVRVFQNHQVL